MLDPFLCTLSILVALRHCVGYGATYTRGSYGESVNGHGGMGQNKSGIMGNGQAMTMQPWPTPSPVPVPSPSPPPSYEARAIDAYLPSINGKPFTHGLSGNLSAGLTVALINVPLSLALAVASASTPQHGMMAAIWGGLMAAIVGGCQYNIQGPTGALSGILSRYALMFGVGVLPVLSVSSGLVMLLVYVFHLDRYVTFLPSSVIHGFTLGVAILIAGGQIGAAFGLPPISATPHFLENVWNNMELISQGHTHWHSFILFMTMWLALFILVKKVPGVPWMVPIAGMGVIIGYLGEHGDGWRVTTLKDKYGDLSLSIMSPAPLWSSVSSSLSTSVGRGSALDLLTGSVSVAFVGVLESLISGKIADGMTKTSMHQRQEVLAVSMANLAAGWTGGMPVTAALARTALSIRSGANSKLAGIFNAAFTFLIALFCLPLFGYLPLCVVASLLFQVSCGMVEAKHLLHSWSLDSVAFWLTLVCASLCLIFDPTVAIVVGAVLGLLRNAENLARGYSEMTLTRDFTTGLTIDTTTEEKQEQEQEETASRWTWTTTVEGHGQMQGQRQDGNWRLSQLHNIWCKIKRLFTRSQPYTQIPHDQPWPEVQVVMPPSNMDGRSTGTGTGTGTSTSVSISSIAGSVGGVVSDAGTVVYRVIGDLTYISAIKHSQRLKKLDSQKNVIVSFRFCYYVDMDGMDELENTLLHLECLNPHRLILLCGIHRGGLVDSLFSKTTWYQHLYVRRARVFDNVQHAVTFVRTRHDDANMQTTQTTSAGRNAYDLHHQSDCHVEDAPTPVDSSASDSASASASASASDCASLRHLPQLPARKLTMDAEIS